MGVLSGLFGQKSCSICGSEIGMLGNRKLKDGNMCKSCAGKLSVWFQDRSESTVAQIQNQLGVRKAYEDILAKGFNVSRAYGEFGCILIDEIFGNFVALPDTSDSFFGDAKVITSIDQIRDKKPDVIMFKEVAGVDVNVTVTSREEKQTVDGKLVSYNPKHMVYMAQFSVTIRLKGHPFIKSMTVPLNNGSVQIRNMGERLVTEYKDTVRAMLTGYKGREFEIENQSAFYTNNSLKDLIFRTEYNLPDYAYGFKVDRVTNWKQIQEYQYYLAMAEEIKSVLEGWDKC
ncbi:MAG: DUF4428 domain-containing protein [Lachnospiraceae bacterium]|nr:DUF4428 domain-containing protein [Lachnospiraceae bacterium]